LIHSCQDECEFKHKFRASADFMKPGHTSFYSPACMDQWDVPRKEHDL
jgi:hypothetical protein